MCGGAAGGGGGGGRMMPQRTSPLTASERERDRKIEEACPIARATAWRKRFKKVSAVPAFASPLTPVLNPIVGRAQWEIVMRSALMAAVISFVVVGALLSVPVKQQKGVGVGGM